MYSMFLWIYIIPTLLISPMISISMNSWFSIWLTLELNLMTFIPFIIYSNKYYKELSMKYFIVQSISSTMIILSSNMINNYLFLTNNIISMMNNLINISLLIKLGTSPFHSWFINMMNNSNWLNCFMLSTWQKIIPMIIIMYNFNLNIMYLTILLSSLTSAIWGINHQSIRIIMGYSSLNHISWMLINLMINEKLWILYFFTYMNMNLSIMYMFNWLKIFYLNQMFMLSNNFKIFILLNMLSLMSMPPLLGFLIKWYSIFMINLNKNMLLLMMLLMTSLFTFMFYLRISTTLMINYNNNHKNYMIYKLTKKKMSMKFIFFIMSFLNLWILNNWINFY